MNTSPLFTEKRTISNSSLLLKRFIIDPISISGNRMRSENRFIVTILLLCFTFFGYAQKDKDIIPTVDCIRYAGNGIYQASFGYENPTKKEIVIDENGSIIKTNNGKRVAKGLNKFKGGTNQKVFTKEFGAHDFIEWTIVSNNNSHTVVANINSLECELKDEGFIFPVYGQGDGKSGDIIGQELSALADDVAGDTPSDLVFQINNEKVLIEIVPIDGRMGEVISLLGSQFGVLDSDFLLHDQDNPSDPAVFLAGLSAIDVYFPIASLLELNSYYTQINFVRPLYPAMKHSFGDELFDDGSTGNAISQGDVTQGSDIVRESFRLIDSEGNVVEDEECELFYKPANYNQGKFYGLKTLRFGLEKSKNAMTVRMANDIGMSGIKRYGEDTGIYDEVKPELAWAWGAGETTLLRLANAYSALVNGGKAVTPTILDRVQDGQGKTIFVNGDKACAECQQEEFYGGPPPELPDDRAVVILQVLFQPLLALNVEMVGGLV